MRVVHHNPSDPYPNPPPTLTNLKLRKKWHAMALETREALWQEVEGLTTESESDDGIVDPHELLRGIKNKKHSLDAGDDARTTKKPARSNTTSASAPPDNDRGTGNYGAQITSSAARRDIDLSAAVHESCYHLVHGVCCFVPRDPAVEVLRRARGNAWKGGGCVQWTGTSMGESGRGGEEKKCCERRYKNFNGLREWNLNGLQPLLLPAQAAAARGPCAAHAPEPGPGGAHAHGPAHSHARALPCAVATLADMSMSEMCPPSATGPHGANTSQSWWWW
ncbi:hypothetical protein JB92DRAFT_2824544 [Gautieria morchelliformis]|nr:hypothetical protein JB92DRAFT_2824544 [Gautieria morchelliformis]